MFILEDIDIIQETKDYFFVYVVLSPTRKNASHRETYFSISWLFIKERISAHYIIKHSSFSAVIEPEII